MNRDPLRSETTMEAACEIPRPLLPPAELTPHLAALVDRGVDERWVRQLGHAPEAFLARTPRRAFLRTYA